MTAMEDIEMELDLGDPIEPTDEIDFDAPAVHLGNGPSSEMADGEAQPQKVHLRGLDDMAAKDVHAYVREHWGSDERPQIEWVDDTSANLVFTTPEVADAALTALALPVDTALHPLQLRSAHPSTTHPAALLHVRLAVATDRKKARAADESRFYLLHPEHDPREHRTSSQRRRDGDRRRRTRTRRDANDPSAPRRDSISSAHSQSSSQGSHMRRRDRDRDRDRSRRGAARSRSRSRSPARANAGKELLPAGPRRAALNQGKELFADRAAPRSALNEPAELFPARVDATAALFSQRLTAPLTDGAQERSPHREGGGSGGGGGGESGSGSADVSIRGAAGVSIRGAAAAHDEATARKMRELFPDRARNRGKELFTGAPTTAGAATTGGTRQERRRAEGFY